MNVSHELDTHAQGSASGPRSAGKTFDAHQGARRPERVGLHARTLMKNLLSLITIALLAAPALPAQEAGVVAKHAGTLAKDLPVETAVLTHAPEVPPFITRTHP